MYVFLSHTPLHRPSDKLSFANPWTIRMKWNNIYAGLNKTIPETVFQRFSEN